MAPQSGDDGAAYQTFLREESGNVDSTGMFSIQASACLAPGLPNESESVQAARLVTPAQEQSSVLCGCTMKAK